MNLIMTVMDATDLVATCAVLALASAGLIFMWIKDRREHSLPAGFHVDDDGRVYQQIDEIPYERHADMVRDPSISAYAAHSYNLQQIRRLVEDARRAYDVGGREHRKQTWPEYFAEFASMRMDQNGGAL